MHDYIDLQIREASQAAATDHISICHVKSAILSLERQTASKRQDLSRTYLAHHELESKSLILKLYYINIYYIILYYIAIIELVNDMQPGKDAAGQRTLVTICQQGESMDSEPGRGSLRQRSGVQGGDEMG